MGERCRSPRFFPEISLASAVNQAGESYFLVFGDDAQITVQVGVGEGLAFLDERNVILQNARGADDVGFVTLDFQRIVHQAGGDLQTIFENTDVFVTGSEKGFNAASDLDAEFHSKVRLRCIEEQRFRARGKGRGQGTSSASSAVKPTSGLIISKAVGSGSGLDI